VKKHSQITIVAFVVGGLVVAAAISFLTLSVEHRTEGDSEDAPGSGTLGSLAPIVVTYTVATRMVTETAFHAPDWEGSLLIGAETNYRLDRNVTRSSGTIHDTEFVSDSVVLSASDESGTMTWWRFVREASLPKALETGPHPSRLGDLRSLTPPILAPSTVDDWVSSGWAHDAGTGTMFGRPTRVITASAASAPDNAFGTADAITATIDAELGIRYEIEELAGDYVTRQWADGMETGAVIDPSLLSVSVPSSEVVRMEATVPYDHGQHPFVGPDAVGVLDPPTPTLSNGFVITATTLFTMSARSEWSSEEVHWFVSHDLEGPGNERAFVVQAIDGREPNAVWHWRWPFVLNDWNCADYPMCPSFSSETSVEISAVSDAYLFTVDSDMQADGYPVRFMVTWIYDDEYRGVLAGNWFMDESTVLGLANSFIAAGQ